MRKLLLFLFIVAILNSCSSSQPMGGTVRDYNESITFTVDKIEEGKSITVGNSTLSPKKGSKYVFVYLTFTNKSAEQQDLDLNTFSLADTNVKYKLEKVMMPGAINLFADTDYSIRPKDNLRRKLIFSVPLKLKPQNLSVNGKLIPVEYRAQLPNANTYDSASVVYFCVNRTDGDVFLIKTIPSKSTPGFIGSDLPTCQLALM